MSAVPVVSTLAPEPGAVSGLSDRPEREGQPRGRTLRLGSLALDVERGRATVEAQDAQLSPAEFALLHLLVARRGVVMSKEAILAAWSERDAPSPRLVDVLVLRVRGKLAKAGFAGGITTVWGRGYMIAHRDDDRGEPMMPPQSWRTCPQLALA